MKKRDLKDLMVIEVRDRPGGENRYIVKGESLMRPNGWYTLECYEENLINKSFRNLDIVKVYDIISFNTGLNSLISDDNLELIWKRKETPTLTKDEKTILRNLDKKWKYIARDNLDANDKLYLFEEEPVRVKDYYYYPNGGNRRLFDVYNNKVFQSITLEASPLLIEDLIDESSD